MRDPTPTPRLLRSLACIDLLGALTNEERVEVTLDVCVRDGAAPEQCAPVSFEVSRARALRALEDLGAAVNSIAASLCCVTGVPFVDVALHIDGDRVLSTAFPLHVMPRIAPVLDGLLARLGAFSDEELEDSFARKHFSAVSAATLTAASAR